MGILEDLLKEPDTEKAMTKALIALAIYSNGIADILIETDKRVQSKNALDFYLIHKIAAETANKVSNLE